MTFMPFCKLVLFNKIYINEQQMKNTYYKRETHYTHELEMKDNKITVPNKFWQ